MVDRLILYAPNVHCGGGLILMNALLEAWTHQVELYAFLDKRAFDVLPKEQLRDVTWVEPTLISRLQADWQLSEISLESDLVLVFNGVPPLFRTKGSLVVFLQNRLLLGASLSGFAPRTAIRITLESILGRLFRRRVSHYIVQSGVMARSLRTAYGFDSSGGPNIQVLPYIGGGISALTVAARVDSDIGSRFIYVADGLPHKNHFRLLDAWSLLAEQGLFPELLLTLEKYETGLLERIEAMRTAGIIIRNYGKLPHGAVIDLYRMSSALIYPSLAESFGLPLIEASKCNLPILASELDYVYEVCEPADTFDPNSAQSIFRTVKRFMGIKTSVRRPVNAGEFIGELLRLV